MMNEDKFTFTAKKGTSVYLYLFITDHTGD